MSWDDVALLVHRAQAGERRAFGELVERFRSAVFAVAVGRLRNEAEAQELTQEVFIHTMKKLDQLRDPRCFAGWRIAFRRSCSLPISSKCAKVSTG